MQYLTILSPKRNALQSLIYKCYCSAGKNKNPFSATVLLPSTKMPLRLENNALIERDAEINKIHDNVYNWQKNALPKDSTFVLHDGPPYANGSPHMGHAINKILKDTILRSKLLQGRRIDYIPGWDCHGLPIELKSVKQSGNLNALEIRKKARNFATKTIEQQKSVFQSWGVLADWEHPYKTFDKAYIKNQLVQFYQMYEKKLIYRDFKPVYWSPSSKTALAEAELEYNPNHNSTAATVRFKAQTLPNQLQKYKNIYLLIWTTTPWTLPGNQAVCYNSELSYSLVKPASGNELYILATQLVETYREKLQVELEILETFAGETMNGIQYLHPIYKSLMPLLHSTHATSTKGTGLVHTAPAHGPEDFLVALQHDMKINCLVDENGNYTQEAGERLLGLPVLAEGGAEILKLLGKDIIHKEKYVHSYPYDWRTKQPVILRASQQWFIDVGQIKHNAIECIEKIDIIPNANADKHKKQLIDQVEKRPYWCISRQRSWGVPIPVFYNKSTGEPIINRELINHLCTLVEEKGIDCWWQAKSPKDLIPSSLSTEIDFNNVQIGRDILDIWFDSGISWSSVLEAPQIADMYLEGLDQFTGWFQSSLVTSVALRNIAPYKSIYVHGFAVDEKGLKMSKSLGNIVDPQEVMKGSKKKKPYGVDVLRWWVACHANQDATVAVSDNVLKASADEVQKIRSNLRFALGGIGDYRNQKIDYNDLKMMDKYMLHLLYCYYRQAHEYIEDYQFDRLCTTLMHFITNDISALYYTSIKDRLYCDEATGASRLGVQFVLHKLLHLITQSIAPIIPHLAEEIFVHLPIEQKKSNAFFTRKSYEYVRDEWRNDELEELMQVLMGVKKQIQKETETFTVALESEIHLKTNTDNIQRITAFGSVEELCDVFQVANVVLMPDNNTDFRINIVKTQQCKCPRCRKFSSPEIDTLCDRCFNVINNVHNKAELRS